MFIIDLRNNKIIKLIEILLLIFNEKFYNIYQIKKIIK